MADPLSISAGIIAILQLTGTVVQHLSNVARASEERQRLLSEISIINGILNLLKDLAERPQWGESWSTTLKSLDVPNGPLEQFKSALERLASRLKPVRGLKRVEKSLTWPFQRGEVNDILGLMERQKTLFNLALQNDHTRLSQAIRLDLQGLNDSLETVSQNIAQVQIGQSNQEHRHQEEEDQKILAWLSPLNFVAQQSDIISRRQDGTGQWLLDSEKFKTWKGGTGQTLLCPGIPGAGKTMLASIVIQQLSCNMPDQNHGLAYMFCNFRSQLEQTPINLFANLLRQLISERGSVPADLVSMYKSHAHRGTHPAFDEVLKALQSAIERYTQVFIVVDALDECSSGDGTRQLVLDKLRSLQASHRINFMATSRFERMITTSFEHDPWLEIRASESDVRRYLDGQMFRLASCVGKNRRLQEVIKDEIVKAVDGMFLLAQLHLDLLKDKMSIKDVKTALNRLPTEKDALNKAYGSAMERIDSQQAGFRELAKRVLSWITYAKRPLTTLELQHALAVELGEPCLDPDNLNDVDDMISVCAGLVTVDKESSIIRLVHYTTQDYLEGIYFKPDSEIQEAIALICLTYMSFDAFECGYCTSDKMFENLLFQHPFTDYAAKHWQHLLDWNAHLSEAIEIIALKFLKDDKKVSVSFQVNHTYPFYGYFYSLSAPEISGIHYCAAFGLKGLFETLLNETRTPNLLDSDDRTPLSWAAERGHGSVVKLLLDRSDVVGDSEDCYGKTPLWYAAEQGHEAIFRLLIDRDDVRPVLTIPIIASPLAVAARGGFEAIVELLLNRDDIEADSRSRIGETPLALATESGHEAVVKMLVDRDDVEINRKDPYGRTPLASAAELGHEAVVKLLLDRDDVMAGQTPLAAAARGGHEAIVKLLMDRDDVEVDHKDFYGKTPLALAAEMGHEAVVKLLIARDDVEIGSEDGRGRTPLTHATERGHEAIVKLLQARLAS